MKILLLLAGILVFLSCTPRMTKIEAFPEMYSEDPLTVIVLPPYNQSTAAEAKDYYTTTISEPLANAGFYVYSVEVIHDILKQEGLYDIESYDSIPLDKFNEYFGADAVLFIDILEWNTSYRIVSGSVTVSVDFKLVSTKTKEILWSYRGKIKVDTSGDSGNAKGLAGLIAIVATTAIKTATTDYVPQAKKLNIKALKSIPFGKYHIRHQKDQSDMIVIQTIIK